MLKALGRTLGFCMLAGPFLGLFLMTFPALDLFIFSASLLVGAILYIGVGSWLLFRG